MTPQDRSLKHHDIYRKRIGWKCFSELRQEGSVRGESTICVDPVFMAAVEVIWQSNRWWWLHFLFESSCDPPSMHVYIVVSTSSICAVGKVLYLVQEFCLLYPSGRRICISQPTDLDIITSEREIASVEQLAVFAICCTSAHFIEVCGPELQSIPLQAANVFIYLSICASFRVFKPNFFL